jgi:hypothetical protein
MKPFELSVRIVGPNSKQKATSMNNHNAIGKTARDLVIEALPDPQSFSEMEDQVQRFTHWLGNVILHLWLMWLAVRYPAARVVCPHCGGQAAYQRKRQGKLYTLFGVVRYWRAYYLCACQQGHCPLDERLGLRPNALSAEVERLAGMTGVQMPFGKGRDVFEELTLISLSDHSLDKAAAAYGREAQQREAAWYAEALDTEALLRREREQARPMRMYGAIDGGRVQTRGPKGEEQPWRELKVGVWFEAKGQPPKQPNGKWAIKAQNITYYTDIAPADDFGKIAWATGVQRDAHRARELVFLGDGAQWIWNLVELHFPHAIQIVDWFHACAYIAPVAKVAFPDAHQQAKWIEQVKSALWTGDLDAVIAACANHIDPQREDDPAQQAVTYYTNNRQRMDYPTYRANGYHIGSGTIESGVKQIAQQRMKVPGARWNAANAALVAKARAALLSGQWPELASRRTHLRKVA